MAGAILAMRPDGPSRRRPPRGVVEDGGRRPAWVPVALALAALAGAVAALRAGRSDRGKADGEARDDAPDVERSVTIGRTADELYRRWREPETLARVMADLATVDATGGGRFRWRIEAPLDRALEWNTETVDDRFGESVGWRSLPGAAVANEGSVRFRPATGDRGAVATLRLRFDPPGGALAKLLGRKPLDLAADKALRRFKSLVETGETPTTERQPAARADPR